MVINLKHIYKDKLDSNIDKAKLFNAKGKLLSLVKKQKAEKKLSKKKASKKSTLAICNL